MLVPKLALGNQDLSKKCKPENEGCPILQCPRNRQCIHAACAGPQQYPGALIEGCPGGIDIIDQKYPRIGHACTFFRVNAKRVSNIPFPVRFSQQHLRPGFADPFQNVPLDIRKNIPGPGHLKQGFPFFYQQIRLVESPLSQTGRVQGDRHDHIDRMSVTEIQKNAKQQPPNGFGKLNFSRIFQLMNRDSENIAIDARSPCRCKTAGFADACAADMIPVVPTGKHGPANRAQWRCNGLKTGQTVIAEKMIQQAVVRNDQRTGFMPILRMSDANEPLAFQAAGWKNRMDQNGCQTPETQTAIHFHFFHASVPVLL